MIIIINLFEELDRWLERGADNEPLPEIGFEKNLEQ